MIKTLTKWISICALAACTMPLVVSAHALPVNTAPESSATLSTAPQSVVIRFSEHVDVSASSIKVIGPSGMEASKGEKTSVSVDRYTMSIPVISDGNGTYIVSWNAVSADDGHFTKGGYPFAVGAGVTVNPSAVSSAEIVEIATAPEALGMTIELTGHGLLWAALLMFAFALRPILISGRFDAELDRIRRAYHSVVYTGVFLVVAGGLDQICIKAYELAGLQSASFIKALPLYIGTAAGAATLYRIIAALVFVGVFLWGRKIIFAAKKLTVYEVALFFTLCFFAYQRARISHATSNPFHPAFSIGVNFLHVIEKDIWAGIICILVFFVLNTRLRIFLDALIPRAFAMLAIDFGAVAVTACYIVWLHLKSFDNLFTTQWGGAFLELLISALLLVAIRMYHIAARLWKPRLFARILPATLTAELAFALLVLYFSSVVIITSPPLGQPPTRIFTATDQGASITLQRDALEDGMLELTITGNHVDPSMDPVVTINNESSTVGPLSIELAKRFVGGYVFSEGLLASTTPYKMTVTAQQAGAYDAHATFEIRASDFKAAPGWETHRPLDTFTIILILIGSAAIITALILWRLSFLHAESRTAPHNQFLAFIAVGSFLLAAFATTSLIGIFHTLGLENPFKYKCESDGNMWHVMQPMKAGVPTSQIPAEGCMWGMGSAMYMFGDMREYEYNSTLAHALVSLDHAQILAGQPVTLTVSLKNTDGSPAKLFVDMEKLIHVVIISKDESVFAHIHPDDVQPLTKEEIDTSTFTVDYTFPKSGPYLISIDYANGLTLESKQFHVDVAGSPTQAVDEKIYPSPGIFEGYTVSLNYFQPFAGEVSTLKYTFTKDGKPVTNVIPYLSAAMHISVVKNDFSTFIHTHGEVHPPGVPLPPIIIKNGQVVHSMAMMVLPPTFGPLIDTHLIFPSAGVYTVWGEFKVGDKVIPTSFTVRVE